MKNYCDEFPHEVLIKSKERVEDEGGGFTTTWIDKGTMTAFVDTPSSKERYLAQQTQNPLDRYMYFPYNTDIKSNQRLEYDGEEYELAGRPEDQGGQHEIMRVALKLVAPNANLPRCQTD